MFSCFRGYALTVERLHKLLSQAGVASRRASERLMLEHLESLANASAQAISKIKFDKIVVWETGGSNGNTATANFLQGMARTLPPMMQVMKDIGGVEIPESLIKFKGGTTSAEEANRATPTSAT